LLPRRLSRWRVCHGWVKIPEGYRKALFSALLLEVVGCVVLLFRQDVLKQPSVKEPVVMPYTTYKLHREKNFSDAARIDYVLKDDTAGTGYGNVSVESLLNLGLFDNLKADKNGFAQITFTDSETGWRKTVDDRDKNWDIDIKMDHSSYVVVDRKDSVEYAYSRSFNKGERNLHLVKALDNKFYLVQITSARRTNSTAEKSGDNFVTFFIVQLETELKR
jgi:hypothetical protein